MTEGVRGQDMDKQLSENDRRLEEVFKVRLKKRRNELKYTTAKLAELVGIAKSSYGGYEQGAKFPSIGNLEKLAEVLHTSTDYLIGITDNPIPIKIKIDENDPSQNNLNWNGEPLTPEQLDIINQLLRQMVRQNNKLNHFYKEVK